MLTKQVLEVFGTRAAVAKALDISRAAVSKWPRKVPEGSAYKLQVLTSGKLLVDTRLYSKSAKRSRGRASA